MMIMVMAMAETEARYARVFIYIVHADVAAQVETAEGQNW